MAQAGIHGLVGVALRKVVPKQEWLVFGLVLGNLFPDADNLAVAAATMLKLYTEGLHRTFTHSIFTTLLILGIFYLVGKLTKKSRWITFGIGFSAGILLHILLDLIIWFDGVAILWPLPVWVDLWRGVSPAVWFEKLLLPAEFLFFALFFWSLAILQKNSGTKPVKSLKYWIFLQFGLFILFSVLVYLMGPTFMTIYGLIYLLSLGLAWGITIRMRNILDPPKKFVHPARPVLSSG
jgi:membrane-bound metal-dependent hydrolase YbcI (DUF457 family)